MAEQAGGFISGDPEVMMTFVANGPDPRQVDGGGGYAVKGALVESGAYATTEAEVVAAVMEIATKGKQEIDDQVVAARTSGHLYLSADAQGKAAMDGLTENWGR